MSSEGSQGAGGAGGAGPGAGGRSCTQCGGPLVPGRDRCVYCNTPVQPVQAPPQVMSVVIVEEPPEAEIPEVAGEGDLCRGCGYDLKGLATSGACPECGKPVHESVRGDYLKFASEGYLRSLHRGVVLVQTALVASLMMWVAAFAASAAAPALASLEEWLGIIPGVLQGVGWWCLSMPDPSVGLTDPGDKPRQIVRTTVLVSSAAQLTSIILASATPGMRGFSPSMNSGLTAGTIFGTVAGIGMIVAFIAHVVQFFAAMQYLRWVAPRIPSRELERTTKSMTWVIALMYFPGCCLAGFGLLVAPLVHCVFLNGFRSEFKRIRQETYGSTELWGEPDQKQNIK